MWEGIENDEEEWMPKEGRRRGGRRISRRISELLENFQSGEGDRQTDEQSGLEILSKVTFSSLTANHIHSNTKNQKSKFRSNNVVKKFDGNCASVRSACDWSSSNILLTNRRAAGDKRKANTEYDSWCPTKKRRPGSFT